MLRSRRWLKSWLLATCLASSSLIACTNDTVQAREGRAPRPFGPSCFLVHDLDLPATFPADEGRSAPQKVVQKAQPPIVGQPVPDEILASLQERAQSMLEQSAKWICGFEYAHPFGKMTSQPSLQDERISTPTESDPSMDDEMTFDSICGANWGSNEVTAMAEGYQGFMSVCPSQSYAQSIVGDDYLSYDHDPSIAMSMDEARKAIAQSVFAPFEIHQPIIVVQPNMMWDRYLACDLEKVIPTMPGDQDRDAATSLLVGLGCLSPELDDFAFLDEVATEDGNTCPAEKRMVAVDDEQMESNLMTHPTMIDLHFVRTQPDNMLNNASLERANMVRGLRKFATLLDDISRGIESMADSLQEQDDSGIWISNDPAIDEWDLH